MRRGTGRLRLTRALVAALVLTAACGALVSASSAQPATDFTLASVHTAWINPSGYARFQARVGANGHYPAPVSLSISGLPSGVTASFGANPVGVPGSSVVTLTASATTGPGTAHLTLTGTSQGTSHSVGIALQVSPRRFALTLDPADRAVRDGESTDYTITARRSTETRPITLSMGRLPHGVTATITPQVLAGAVATATVHVDVAPTTAAARYRFIVRGVASASSKTQAPAFLTVGPAVYPDFPISGDVATPISIGTTAGIDVRITNPFDHALNVSALDVHVTGTSNPACTASNFVVTQYAGTYPLIVAPNRTKALHQLGVAVADWPTITLRDRPNVNQDYCKNVTITLSYGGTGTGR